jgi:hypothetical protein
MLAKLVEQRHRTLEIFHRLEVTILDSVGRSSEIVGHERGAIPRSRRPVEKTELTICLGDSRFVPTFLENRQSFLN